VNTKNTKPYKEARSKVLQEKIAGVFYDASPFNVLIDAIVDLEEEIQHLKADVDNLRGRLE
jgi:ubiquinone biosynthesis protein UbiJ